MKVSALLTRTLLLCPTLVLGACSFMVPKDKLPWPLTNDTFGDQVKVASVPLPIIASNPNEGIKYGGLNAFMLHNAKDELSTLVVPRFNYNEYFGTTVALYAAFFPSPTSYWKVNFAQSTNINYNYDLTYRESKFMEEKLALEAFLFAFTDGSARFFGFGANSATSDESNYGDQEIGFSVAASYKIGKHYQIVVGERLRSVNIVPGAVTSLPNIKQLYTPQEVPGIDGFNAHSQRIAFIYSTLDSSTVPTYGGYGRVALENCFKALGCDANYRNYNVELKGFIPFDNARYITAFRAAYNQTLGDDVPFLERSILGGENTLRGYGNNRFIDSSYLVFNFEERIRLFRWEVFGVTADWEIAPFFDVGAVMESLAKMRTKDFEFNPGIGVRAVVRPNIVGRVDVGVGSEGPAVFVGLSYPF